MFNRIIKALASMALLSVAVTAFANDEVMERIDYNEEAIFALEEKVDGSKSLVRAFDADRLNVGGFVHTAYTITRGRDRTASGFNRQNFELLISSDITEKWSFFFAGGFLRESDDAFGNGGSTSGGTFWEPRYNSKNKNPQIISWVNFAQSNTVNFMLGRMITPHGIINIEHFPGILLDPEQPQFLRPFSGSTIFPNFISGVQVHGSKNFGAQMSTSLSYAVYAGNINTTATDSQTEKLISGGRLAIGYDHRTYEAGFNYSHGYRGDADKSPYRMYGFDFKVQYQKLLFKAESYFTNENSGDRRGYYFQPAYLINDKWVAFYKFDVLDQGGHTVGREKEHVLGVNYLPVSNIRLRAVYTSKKFDRARDASTPSARASIFQLSGTFSF